MVVKGIYRDIISRSKKVIFDAGWNSNSITIEFGKLLTALMKKHFTKPLGVEFLAVGKVAGRENEFRTKVKAYFTQCNAGNTNPIDDGTTWVWAKKVTADDMEFLNAGDEVVHTGITNTLRVKVTFLGTDSVEGGGTIIEPAAEKSFEFTDFSLVSVPWDSETNTYDVDNLHLINYVKHGAITKDTGMELTRTIKLTFPINVVQ